MGGGGQERPGLQPVHPGSRTGMLRRAPARGSGRERSPEVWGRAVCTPDVRRCPGGHTAVLAHARGGEGELAPVYTPPPPTPGEAGAPVAEAGGGGGAVWGQACDVCEGQAEIVAVSALPTRLLQLLGLS